MHSQIMHVDNMLKYYYHHIASLSSLFLDILFVYSLPFLMLKHKARVVLFALAYIISTSYIVVNVVYSRYFDTYLPLKLYFEFNNLDGLGGNFIYALTSKDCLFVLTSNASFYALWQYRRNQWKMRRATYAILPFFLFFLLLLPMYKSFSFIEYLYRGNVTKATLKGIDYKERLAFYSNFIHGQQMQGLRYGLLLDMVSYAWHRYNQKGNTNIDDYASFLSSENYGSELLGKDKNLIIILVESLASLPIHFLFKDETAVSETLGVFAKEGEYFPQMASQTQLGESSDGQFVYLTGLLPLKNTITVNEMESDTVLALPRVLDKYYTQMIIPTGIDEWSQAVMCKKYGFSKLYSNKDYKGNNRGWLTDKQLFEFADSLDNELIHLQPFFSIILTSSMHSPYNHLMDETDIHPLPDSLSVEMRNYLHNTHYTDKYLGLYIESLKRKGLYDNTIIVILADHKPNTMALNMKNKELCADIPMIILNSPVKIEMDSSQRINQTCVFPTILDLLNVDSEWRGVGKSLLMPDSARNSDREKRRTELEQAISEAIIWNNYSK